VVFGRNCIATIVVCRFSEASVEARVMTEKPPDNDEPSVKDNFLYLLFQMERAIEAGGMLWPSGQRGEILCRLNQIAKKVASAAIQEGSSSKSNLI
jgi:hypothetical protein